MKTPWGHLMRMARRILNLTQEDFASDFGRSQSLIAQWESGRKAIPSDVRRNIIDILGGYYKDHPNIKDLLSAGEKFDGFVSIHSQLHRGVYGNMRFISAWNSKMHTEFNGANILSYIPLDHRLREMAEKYTIRMLEKRSDILNINIIDKSILFDNFVIKREITAVDIGHGRVLLMRERLYKTNILPEDDKKEFLMTMDGTIEEIT